MILYFWDLNQYRTFDLAKRNGALHEVYPETNSLPWLHDGAINQLMNAIKEGALMVDGKARVSFVLTTEHGNVIDVMGV